MNLLVSGFEIGHLAPFYPNTSETYSALLHFYEGIYLGK